jgi:hypothetical protein
METESAFTQKMADEVAKAFSLMLNIARTYGGDHPSTLQSAAGLGRQLAEPLTRNASLTLLCNGESIYLENFCVDKKVNAHSIAAEFRQLGLQSITFMREIRDLDCQIFNQIYYRRNQLRNVENLRKAFSERGGAGIQFNYVTFQKVTADEQVLDKQTASYTLKQLSATKDLTVEVKRSLDQVASLKELLANETRFVDTIVQASLEGGETSRPEVARRLQELNAQVAATDADQPDSLEEMVQLVCKLRTDLAEGLTVQKQLGAILAQDSAVVNEVEALSLKAMTRLIAGEYAGGTKAPRRLASIIRRIAPDVNDLKRLMPLLKSTLTTAGMPLKDFLELVSTLQLELKSENMTDALGKGAQNIGLTTEEIMQAIAENPTESAKLIILASEIQQECRSDPEALSSLLTDYIEKLSGKMASIESPGPRSEAPLDTIVNRLEKQFLEKLKGEGVSPTVLGRIEEQLKQRFPVAFEKTRLQWLSEKIMHGNDLTVASIVAMLEKAALQESDVGVLRQSVSGLLADKGISEADVQQIFTRLSQHFVEKKITLPLPTGVINARNTMYFLERQVKINVRYSYPVSCLMVSVIAVNFGGQWQKIDAALAQAIMPQVFDLLTRQVRDVDMIGSYETGIGLMPFVILPFTELKGTLMVKKRMQDKIAGQSFKSGETPVTLRAVVSATPFEKAVTPDLTSFRELLKNNHQKALSAAQVLSKAS